MSLINLMTNYKITMHELIHEKAEKTFEKTEIKTKKTKELVKTLFKVIGDEPFIENVQNDLNSICETKPGRILIKSLSTLISAPIEIKQAASDNCIINQKTDNISIEFFNSKIREYHTIFDEKLPNEKFPSSKKGKCQSYVRLAHEMIHLLHYKKDKTNFNKRIENISRDIFPLMDTREEQFTITGVDEAFLTKKINRGKLEKTDILCENAFLLALKLAPRNSHRELALYNKNKEKEVNKELETAYYDWLEDNLFRINNIPEDEKTNKEFIKEFAEKYPKSLKTIDNSLKNDKEFFTDLVEYNKAAIKHLPGELLRDKDFLTSLINKSGGNYFCLPKDIRTHNTDLALLVIKKKPAWYHCLDKELQNNPLFAFANPQLSGQ